jgi:macrolide transport system ATP-binding/permease protein
MLIALHDLRFAARLLRRSPVFTVAAVLTLALGVGANTAVFSVVNAVLLRPLPVRDADRLVVLATRQFPSQNLDGVSYADIEDYRASTTSTFEDIAAYSIGPVGLFVEGERAERVFATWVTGNYFQLLDLSPASGRWIGTQDVSPDRGEAVAVLGHSAWQRRFGGAPSVIGLTVRVNGRPTTIIGVAPPDFVGTFAFADPELYLPLGPPDNLSRRDARGLHALARLRPGVPLVTAQTAMNAVATRLANQFPDTNRGVGVEVVHERFARPVEDAARSSSLAAIVTLSLAGLILVAAAVNVANLVLARSIGRNREFAIRAALGAGRGRLARQLIAEALLLASLGGTAGMLVAFWTSRALALIIPPGDLPVHSDFQLDWRVVGYGVGLTLVTTVLVGSAAALRTGRTDLQQALRGRHSLRSVFVVAQLAVCFVLLVSAGLFGRSLVQMERVDLGFRPDAVLNLHMDVGQLGYTEQQGRAFFQQIEQRIQALPGTESVSFAVTMPFDYVRLGQRVEALGRPAIANDRVSAGQNLVSAGYFGTMGITIVRGRSFSAGDDPSSLPVAIVNRRFAEMLWPGEDAIGRRFSIAGASAMWFEIVGVTETGKYWSVYEGPRPFFYLPLAQHYAGLRAVHVRTQGSPEAVAASVMRTIADIEPRLPLYDVQSMRQALEGGYGFFLARISARSTMLFGVLGFVLALVGLYGVVAFITGQRTHEFGVRLALGANRNDILALVLKEGLRLVGAGLVAGLCIALAGSGLLSSFLFGVSATDPLTFAGTAPLLAVVALAACLIPAWRATRIDPLATLRSE